MLEQIESESVEATEQEKPVEAVEGVKQEENPEEQKEKAKKRLSDRNRELTFRLRQAERELEAERKKTAEIAAKVTIKNEPDPDDYADRDKYVQDRESWKDQERQRIRAEESVKLRQSIEQERYQSQIEKQKEGYIAGRVDAIKDDPKYHEYEKEIDKVVDAFEAPEIQDLIIAASKQGPKIVKYLGTNPDELEEIASASPKERVFLMGKLVAKLEAKPVKNISSAPNPIRSEKGGATRTSAPTGKAFDPSKESFRAYSQRINGFR